MTQAVQQEPSIEEALEDLRGSKSFIPSEFLTWFWFQAETRRTFDLSGGKGSPGVKVQIWVDDRITLESQVTQGVESVMRGGDPSQTYEAAMALLGCKTVKEIRAGFLIEDLGEFTAIISKEDLNLKQISLPFDQTNEENKAPKGALPVEVRLQKICILHEVYDQIYSLFLTERLSKNWENFTVKEISQWMIRRSEKKAPSLTAVTKLISSPSEKKPEKSVH